jgi:hypothetical protein
MTRLCAAGLQPIGRGRPLSSLNAPSHISIIESRGSRATFSAELCCGPTPLAGAVLQRAQQGESTGPDARAPHGETPCCSGRGFTLRPRSRYPPAPNSRYMPGSHPSFSSGIGNERKVRGVRQRDRALRENGCPLLDRDLQELWMHFRRRLLMCSPTRRPVGIIGAVTRAAIETVPCRRRQGRRGAAARWGEELLLACDGLDADDRVRPIRTDAASLYEPRIGCPLRLRCLRQADPLRRDGVDLTEGTG